MQRARRQTCSNGWAESQRRRETYSTPADSSQDETSALEAWWRKIDAPEVQGAVPTEAILKGLMNIGHQGHPLPSSTLHWHLDTADRAPSRVRIDNAARLAGLP